MKIEDKTKDPKNDQKMTKTNDVLVVVYQLLSCLVFSLTLSSLLFSCLAICLCYAFRAITKITSRPRGTPASIIDCASLVILSRRDLQSKDKDRDRDRDNDRDGDSDSDSDRDRDRDRDEHKHKHKRKDKDKVRPYKAR
jgi:hypothetical protein